MTFRFLFAAASAGFLLAAVSPAGAQSQAPAAAPSGEAAGDAAADPVVAIVDGRELRRSDVVESAQGLPPAYQQNLDRIFPALRDRLVDLTLLAEEGRAQGLQNDAAVRKSVAAFEDQAVRQVLLQRHLEKTLTDEAVKARYQKLVDGFEPKQEVHARHILVETKEAAEKVIGELEAGADFAELAKTSSTGPSAPQGGDLGYFTADQMVPEFADAAFKLAKGEITKEPVKTQFGWHVIKVEDRRETKPPSFEEARPQIENELSQDLVKTFLADLRKKADIETFDLPAPPAEAPAAPDAGAGQPPAAGAGDAAE